MNGISKLSFLLFIVFIKFSLILSFDIDFKDLENYLDNENSILEVFDKYLDSEGQRISHLRQIYELFLQQNTIALKDKDLFLSHPNDVYLLIKRMAIEWKDVENLLEPNKQILREFNFELNKTNSHKFNFTNIVRDYEKIVYYYESDIESAANGVITYTTPSGERKTFKSLSNQTLNAFDCYLIGKQSLKNDDYFAANLWLSIALNRTDNETTDELKADILEHLSVTAIHSEKYELAIKTLKQCLSLSPKRETNKILLGFLQNLPANFKFIPPKPEANDKDNQEQINAKDRVKEGEIKREGSNETFSKEFLDNMDYLCLGRTFLNDSMQSELKCFYLNTTSKPYLRLTRVRVEELYKSPQIVLIHNFLSEQEVETMKNLSMPSLSRLQVIGDNNTSIVSDYRIASGEFLYENSSKDNTILNVVNRIGAITGLNVSDSSSDGFNVIHYGVGGVYEIHHDTSPNKSGPAHGRMSTWINYLSDVDAGGATVLPKLNITVFPRKYSAIFWYNILRSGEIDSDLPHTGCPVLYGDKWIATRWIRFDGQGFNNLCGLNEQDRYGLQ